MKTDVWPDENLSVRLKTIAGMVPDGMRAADIGTDHAYLPIALASSGKCPYVIASDISPDAVRKAREHVDVWGLDQKVSVLLRDGLQGYQPGDADVLIMSGMGGPLMIRILSDAAHVTRSFQEMILSPQSEVASARRWLFMHGFKLVNEALVKEKRHDYFIMKAVPLNSPDAKDDIYDQDEIKKRVQLRYGPRLLLDHSPVLKEFLEWEIQRIDRAIQAIDTADRGRKEHAVRRQELEEERKDACSALMWLTI